MFHESSKRISVGLFLALLLITVPAYAVKTYKTSDIDKWERFQLDRSNFGDYAIEPSLYVEAKRRSAPAN